MAECFGLRPQAKALACSSGVTYTPGFGTPARWASRAIIWCNSGAYCSSTGTACDIFRAIVPLPQYMAKLNATATITITTIPVEPPMSPPSRISTAVRAAMSSPVFT